MIAIAGIHTEVFCFPQSLRKCVMLLLESEAHGGVVVKAVRYKPAGRGFDSQ